MRDIEQYISPLVEQMFPSFYQEEGKGFIRFVKAYYEWLEQSNNALYHSRNISNYADIDRTMDEFIVHFKEKYLKNIQFNLKSNEQLFIKNAIDFHRAKGSERAIDLFFRLVYGQSAQVYYPGDDIFRLSDGEWFEPVYLEVTRTDKNIEFIGKTVTGTKSGATAFVDRLIRRNKSGKYIDVMYISQVSGDFQTGEIIKFDSNLDGNPKIIGSMNSADVVSGGADFILGETVNFVSNNGGQGKAIVNSIANVTGVVDFKLIDGGFGYNSNSKVLVSNVNLTLGNVRASATRTAPLFDTFETITQDLANVTFSAATKDFSTGDYVYSYYGNNQLAGTGEVVYISQITGGNTGYAIVSLSGNVQTTGTYYTSGNSDLFNVDDYNDISATANIIAYSSNVTIYNTSTTGTYEIGEQVYQTVNGFEVANGVVRDISVDVSNTTITLTNVQGVFKLSTSVVGRISGASATLDHYDVKVGVVDVENSFYTTTLNSVSTSTSSIRSTITRKSAGNNATFKVGNLSYVETALLNTDYLTSKRHTYLQFANATTQLTTGDQLYKYYTNGALAARALVLSVNQVLGEANGFMLVYTQPGNTTTFSPSSATNVTNTAHTTSNLQSAVILSDSPVSFLTFNSANGTIANGEVIYRYYANGVVSAQAKVIRSFQATGSPTGNLIFAIKDGNTSAFGPITSTILSNSFYTTANAVTAVVSQQLIDGAIYKKLPIADAFTIGIPFQKTAGYTGFSFNFNPSTDVNSTTDFITVPGGGNVLGNGEIVKYSVADGNTALTNLSNGSLYYVGYSNSTGFSLATSNNGSKIDLTAGVNESGHTLTQTYLKTQVFNANSAVDATNEFISLTGNRFQNGAFLTYSANSGTQISGLSDGASYYAVAANSSGLKLSNTYGGNAINISKGLTENHSLTMNDAIINYLHYDNFTVGRIRTITSINQGSKYSDSPFVLIYDPLIYGYGRKDYSIRVTGATGAFAVGEIIQGQTSEAIARVLSYNQSTGTITATRLNITKSLAENETIIGATSGFQATVLSLTELTTVSGFNAIATGNAISTNGSVTSLRVIDSGIGYVDKENAIFFSTTQPSRTGIATLNVNKQGIAEGRYKETKGFISSDKRIHDGEYYQEYSYEVIAGLPFETWKEMFQKVLHVAGTKLFGKFQTIQVANSLIDIKDSNTISSEIYNMSFNASSDVDTTNDFISLSGNTGKISTFNALYGINSTTGFITTITGNRFANTDKVKYLVSAGNVAITPLANGSTYYIKNPNSSGFFLSSTIGGATLAIEPGSIEEGHTIYGYGNPFSNGTVVQYLVAEGNTQLADLRVAKRYYVRYANNSGIKLSETTTGSILNIITAGSSETGHFIKTVSTPAEKFTKQFNANSGVTYFDDGLTEKFNAFSGVATSGFISVLDRRNNFKNGQAIVYTVDFGNTAIVGLTAGNKYYIRNGNSTGFYLSSSPSGSVITLTKGSNETGHNLSVYGSFITIPNNPFQEKQLVKYYTSAGNTVLNTLSNNATYYVYGANSSGIRLSSELEGSPSSVIYFDKGLTETGHYITSEI